MTEDCLEIREHRALERRVEGEEGPDAREPVTIEATESRLVGEEEAPVFYCPGCRHELRGPRPSVDREEPVRVECPKCGWEADVSVVRPPEGSA